MSKSLKKNYFSAASNQIMTGVIGSVALFYISRALEAGEIGAYSYASSICSYFILILGSFRMGSARLPSSAMTRAHIRRYS